MKARYKHLVSHSIQMALAAVEIYNKPAFHSREQVFAVLMVAAWESLLKARVLQLSKNQMSSLYIKENPRKFKLNRNKQKFTIDVYEAMRRTALPDAVSANIGHLVEIRDAAIHLTATSPNLSYLVFSLGAASVANYHKLVDQWFSRSLDRYNFFVMPLAFDTPRGSIQLLNTNDEPSEIAALIESIAEGCEAISDTGNYQLACQIEVKLISAKKAAVAPQITAALVDAGQDVKLVQRTVSPLDRYPLSARQLVDKVKERVPGVTSRQIYAAIKSLKMKTDARFSKFSYPTKAAEAAGPSKATGSIYNEDAAGEIEKYLRSLIQPQGIGDSSLSQ